MRRLRSPWSRLGEARGLLESLAVGGLPMARFAERFGADVLGLALDGEAGRVVAWLLAVEAAERVCVPEGGRCPHMGEADVTFDLERGLAYCEDCEAERVLGFDEAMRGMVEQAGPRPADHLDRCNVCDDLAELVPFRVLLAGRLVTGRACPACAAFTGET